MSNNKYKNDLIQIECHVCKTVFLGTRKRKTCSKSCTRISKLNGMSIHHEKHFCKDCGIITKEKIKYGSLSIDKVFKSKRCKSCSVAHRINWRKEKNKQISEQRKLTYADRMQKIKTRMQTDNPMFKPGILSKVRNTIIDKIQNGTILYKRGKDHHLWKGNRDNNHIIRTSLNEWKKKILKESQYKCQICGSNKKLEIHHVEPLRDIVNKFTDKPLSQYDSNSPEFTNLVTIINNYHEVNNVGQCVCEKCHANIDPYRKQTFKYEN